MSTFLSAIRATFLIILQCPTSCLLLCISQRIIKHMISHQIWYSKLMPKNCVTSYRISIDCSWFGNFSLIHNYNYYYKSESLLLFCNADNISIKSSVKLFNQLRYSYLEEIIPNSVSLNKHMFTNFFIIMLIIKNIYLLKFFG